MKYMYYGIIHENSLNSFKDMHNFTLPGWTNNQWTVAGKTGNVYDLLMELYEWQMLYRYSASKDRIRLRGG